MQHMSYSAHKHTTPLGEKEAALATHLGQLRVRHMYTSVSEVLGPSQCRESVPDRAGSYFTLGAVDVGGENQFADSLALGAIFSSSDSIATLQMLDQV